MAEQDIKLGADFSKVESEAKDASKAISTIANSAEQAAKELSATETKAGKALDGVAKATEKAAEGNKKFGQTALESGRIVQDFAQGGVGGIINNLEGFARAVGGGPGLAGALTLLGVGFLLLKDPVKNFVTGILEGSNAVPPLTNNLDKLGSQLESTKDRLKDLREKQSLTNAELAEYNVKIQEQARLEADLKKAKQQAADVDLINGQKSEEDSKRQEQRIAALKKVLANSGKEIAEELSKATIDNSAQIDGARKRIQQINKEYRTKLDLGWDEKEMAAWKNAAIQAQQDFINKAAQDIKGTNASLVADALSRGNEDRLKELIKKLGPNSELAKDLSKGLNDTLAAVEFGQGLEKIAERVTPSLKKLIASIKEKSEAIVKQQQKEQEEKDLAQASAMRDVMSRQTAGLESDKLESQLDIIRAADKEGRDNGDFETDQYGRLRKRRALNADEQYQAVQRAKEIQQQAFDTQGLSLDDKFVAQLAIQEQITANQQEQASRANTLNNRVNSILQQGGTIPSINEFGW